MNAADLKHTNFSVVLEKQYGDRAPDFSRRFLKWFLEHIFRLDEFTTDDACVDGRHDKGVDAIYVDQASEIVYIVQAKTKTNEKATLGDIDLKDFFGTLAQFTEAEKIKLVASETKNERLKQAISRCDLAEKVSAGYEIQGVFISNVSANEDAISYLRKVETINLYDAERIAREYVDLSTDGGITREFIFDTSDSDVIKYDAGGAGTRIFLAPAVNLTRMDGISDGSLFEQNVRLSLGNTKVNKSIKESIRDKSEHANFPLYHNGINVLCSKIIAEDSDSISIQNYVVVNGAQSLASLLSERSRITDELKILVKLIEVKGNTSLSQKITRNSNNQNSIKARDMKSNNKIQLRIKQEVDAVSGGRAAFEVKQGEINRGKEVISNEVAGLIMLAADLKQPWNSHQKYKVMDELHSEIFGRPNVTGARVLALWACFEEIPPALRELENVSFSNYTLTRYFLLHVVMEIIREDEKGRRLLNSLDQLAGQSEIDKFAKGFGKLALNAAIDLNAEISPESDDYFDYKNELKSQKWCKATVARLLAQFKKDAKRGKAETVAAVFADIL